MEFRWRGELIPDIEEWAASRGERMVKYKATRKVPNIFSGKMDTEVQYGEMPETFWRSLLIQHGWVYEEIKGD